MSEWQPARIVDAHAYGLAHGSAGPILKVRETILGPTEKRDAPECDAKKFYECEDGTIVCEHEILTD